MRSEFPPGGRGVLAGEQAVGVVSVVSVKLVAVVAAVSVVGADPGMATSRGA